ncbi:MAG: hypothetical protein ABW186_07775 [Rhodanobacteraceae bacterium]
MNARMLVAMAGLAVAHIACADDTLTYRSTGGCAGDFERVELKGLYLRVDGGGASGGSMIYDHGEKIAWFLDSASRTFIETEMDEDAVDLQSDITKSMRTRMRREGGVDPYEIAQSLCPGAAAASRDQVAGEPIDCGNGVALGGATSGADGGQPVSPEQMAEAMKRGGGMAIDPDMRAALQKMMQDQIARMPPEQREQMQRAIANGGGMMMPGMPQAGAARPPPKPERIDRDLDEVVIDGIACTRREHLRGGVTAGEDCLATPAALHLGEKETQRIARFGQSIRAWSRSLVPGEMQPKVDDRVLVRRICYAGGQETGRATLAIDTAPIPGSRFEVPAGYAPMDIGVGGPQGRERR